ncbi:serine hydrolase [Limnoglobus roseus]|uniref:Serine hydrolase n=1 Tax=Limnoglobus roseus TaxID=2598579 RepID=A0A5C1A956_9BACT|nr:serine hydrolase [Limnoglobus roseus]QEL14342.1 serine hydrolase [Limnoglobus roseus]
MRRALALLSLVLFVPIVPAADPLDGFDDAVRKAMKLHAVPGLGVAIIKDGKVVLAKGYGVREVGKPEAVTENSLFAIGSVSKSFTAALAAMLVDEGKLKWDDRIKEHVSDFQMKDNYLTEEIRLRDTLSHRTGLDRHDMVWYGGRFTTPQLVTKLRDMKPAHQFRTNFVYNNLMYMVAGQTVAKVVGKSWDDVVAERLFKPLGMATANTSTAKLPKDGDVAMPHERRKKGLAMAVPWLNIDCIGPAGSINASAADMAKYVQFQLTRGKVGDKRLVKAAVFDEMHKAQMLVPKGISLFNGDAKSSAYGFGWFLSDYHGRTLIEHGGNIDGMTAQVGFLPDEKLGVVFLANLGTSTLPAALMFDTFDRYLGLPLTNDRVEGTSLLMWAVAAGTQVAGVQFNESKRQKDAKPPVPLADFAGKYEDTLYEAVELTTVGDKLRLKWTNFAYDLEFWQFGTFRGTDPDGRWPSIGVHFLLDENGQPTEMKLAGLNVDDVRFKRKKGS